MCSRETFGRSPDGLLIVLVDEMGSEAAAALHQISGVFFMNTFATLAVDALPVAEEIRGIEYPHSTAIRILEADPIMYFISARHAVTLQRTNQPNQTVE